MIVHTRAGIEHKGQSKMIMDIYTKLSGIINYIYLFYFVINYNLNSTLKVFSLNLNYIQQNLGAKA